MASKNKKSLKFISIALVLSLSVGGILTPPARADNDGAVQTVNVVVPTANETIEIVTPSDGTDTKTAHVEVEVRAKGAGTIVIRDQNGVELYRYEKTTDDEETLTFPVELVGGPGEYQLTAYLNYNNGTAVSQTVTVYYLPTDIPVIPIIPPIGGGSTDENGTPNAPNTGYWQIFGRAVPINQVLSAVIEFVILVGAIIFLVFIVRKRKANRSAKTATP